MCSVMAGLTALAGYSSYRSGQEQANAQAAAYRAQADAAERNAQIEGRKQEQIADNYAEQARQLQQRRRIIAGQQAAQAGSAGLSMSGSALDILSAGYDAYNEDQMTLLGNQRNDNYNSRVAQSNYLNQAAGMRAAASNVKANARAQGMATILGTAASIYGMRDTFWKAPKSYSMGLGNRKAPAYTAPAQQSYSMGLGNNVNMKSVSNWSVGNAFTNPNPLYNLGQESFFKSSPWQLNPNMSRSMLLH